jgi:DNA-binding NarL/FixJ family response regulator
MNNETKANLIRLTVIDNHPIVFLGIELMLKKFKANFIEFTNQYFCGFEAINDMSNINSDVILIDLCLPDIKGYELAKLILDSHPDTKIGIYTSMLDRDSILNSFKSGVMGYLPKTARPDELMDLILTISKGERHVRGIVADIIFENEHFFEKQQQLKITKREIEILRHILDGSRNREIAEKLNIAERTVEFHKQNIYIKLGVSNSVDLYKAAMRLNLLSLKDSIY